MVVAAHLQAYSGLTGQLSRYPQINGHVGVVMFFGISGFVICRGLLWERAHRHRISLLGFYIRRIFRILPPLLLYVITVASLASLHIVDGSARAIFGVLTFTCNLPVHQCGGQLGGHTWSLSVEEQFYLVIPFLIAIFGALRSKIFLTAALLSWPIIVLGLYAAKWTAIATTLSEFGTIALGVACALNEERLRRLLTRMPSWTAIIAFAAVILVNSLPSVPLTTVVKVLGLPPLALYALLVSTFSSGLVSKLLNAAPLQIIGAASYSLYLWQQLATYPFAGAGWTFYAISISLCLLVSLASFRWIEQPLIAVGRRLAAQIASSPQRRLATDIV